VIHTWDGNGNLLSDGVNTYTYDHANRLTAASGPSSAVSFGYNDLRIGAARHRKTTPLNRAQPPHNPQLD
jgi:hypothetical protein